MVQCFALRSPSSVAYGDSFPTGEAYYKKGNELSVRSLFIFLYFTRWRLIFIEVVFSNGVVRSSTFRTCL